MYFLSKKNADILFDVISEESINVDYPSFNQIFIEYGQTTGNNLPLMEMNKQFIRYLLANYGRKNTSQQQQQNNISTSMPSRPQGSRSKNVSFDQQLELHRQHFQQYSAPPPPEPPVFKDETPSPSGDLDILMKKALSERKYDPILPQQNPRKLHIGSVIEDEKHKEDLIDIDKFAKPPSPSPSTSPELSTLGFFSKLKTVKQEAEPIKEIESPMKNDVENKNISTTPQSEVQELIKTVLKLSQQLEEIDKKVLLLSQELEAVKYTYNPELKETPPLQSK